MAGYLTAKQTGYEPSAGSNTLTSITLLLGGDATHDQTINIQDLAAIGSVFGQTGVTSCANLNGDVSGTVNILDLSLAASNYDQTGPTVWP